MHMHMHVHALSDPHSPWQVSKDSIVFSQGTSIVPVTSICDGKVPGSEYYTHVQSGCNGQVGPTLAFNWVKPPPDATCVLPANVTIGECSLAYPWSALFVIFLVAVAPLPPLLFAISMCTIIGYADRKVRRRKAEAASPTTDTRVTDQDTTIMGQWLDYKNNTKGYQLAYLLVWLGIAMHVMAVPVIFADAESGEVSEDTCIVRWIAVLVSSTLVILGITLRVGEEMDAEEREGHQDERSTTSAKKEKRRRLVFATVTFSNFLAVIACSVAALKFTENSPAMTNSSESAVVMVDGSFQELELRVTRCRTSTELTTAQFLGVYVPWGLMYLLGLGAHSARIMRKRIMKQRPFLSLYPTMVTLLLHSAVTLIMMQRAAPEAQTFSARTPIGMVLGWVTLVTEVALPIYQKYVRSQPGDDTLFEVYVESGGRISNYKEVSFSKLDKTAGKSHHLFISYRWKTSYDKARLL